MSETAADGSDELALLVAGFMLLVGPFIASVLAAFHPILWIGSAVAMIAVAITNGTSQSATAGADGPRTNCSACGARVPAERPDCDYCGEPLATHTDG